MQRKLSQCLNELLYFPRGKLSKCKTVEKSLWLSCPQLLLTKGHLCAPTRYNMVTESIFNAVSGCGEQLRLLQVSSCYETGSQFSCLQSRRCTQTYALIEKQTFGYLLVCTWGRREKKKKRKVSDLLVFTFFILCSGQCTSK